MDKKHDIQLDVYRALVMLYIVCMLHVVRYFEVGSGLFLTYGLFEMPIIFFIAGAALNVSDKDKGFKELCINRFKRVYLPFFVFAVISISFFLILSFLGLDQNSVERLKIYDYTAVTTLKTAIIFPPAHLWFIPQYFLISISFYIQRKICRKLNRYVYMIVVGMVYIILYVFSSVIPYGSILAMIACYNVFFMAGYLFYRKITLSPMIAVGVLAIVSCVILQYAGFHMEELNSYKWSAAPLYVAYNGLVIVTLGLIFTFIKLPSNKLLRLWNKNGYTIYIYQGLIFFAIGNWVKPFIDKQLPPPTHTCTIGHYL